MYRLASILIVLALPILGMAQTCIEDGVEFNVDVGTNIEPLTWTSACFPNTLTTELSMCELNSITVNLSGAIDPALLVIDITRPNATCPVRFASEDFEFFDFLMLCKYRCRIVGVAELAMNVGQFEQDAVIPGVSCRSLQKD